MRKAIALGMLRKEALAIDGHIEDSAATRFQLGLDAECILEFRSQTGCSRPIVSDRAVFDVDLHAHNLDQAPIA